MMCCKFEVSSNYQIEFSVEMGLEHHLGLTCDPPLGLVQMLGI